MKTLLHPLLSTLVMSYLTCAIGHGADIGWAGPPGGQWNDANNWSPQQVPGADDTVAIPSGASVVIDSAVSIGQLSVCGGAALSVAATGTLSIAATGTLSIAGDLALYGPLTNAGTINWQNGDIYVYNDNDPALRWSGEITNAAGGVFDVGCDRTLTNNQGAPQFHNAGVLRKSAGAADKETDINVFCHSTGTVDVQSGQLRLNGGGKLAGTLQAASAAALYLASGTFELVDTPLFQGQGQVGVNGNVVLVGSLAGTFGVYAGSLDSGSSLTVVSGGVLNIVGTMGLYGSLTNAGTLNLAANMYLYGPLVNAGTANWQQGEIQVSEDADFGWAGGITNQVGGVIDVQCDQLIAVSEGAPQIFNAGTLRKSAGAGSTGIAVAFNNTGTLEARAGTIRFDGVVAQHSDTKLVGGSWVLSDGAVVDFTQGDNITLNQASVTLDGVSCDFPRLTSELADNQGSLTLSNGHPLATAAALTNSGALLVDGTASSLTVAGEYTQTAGSTTLVAGAGITAANFALSGGTLAGTGTLHGNLVGTAATIAPGLSAGRITVNGDATLGTGQILRMQLGGTAPGTQYDQLLVSGGLTVGGALDVSFIDGFGNSAAFHDTFILADAGGAVAGGFSNIANGARLTTADGQHSFAVHFGAGSLYDADKIVLSDFSDAIPPVLQLSDLTAEATGPGGTVVNFTASANDAVQGPVTVIATPASGSVFPVSGGPQLALGTTLVQVSAHDVGGNTANGSFTVSVVDTTPPALTLPPNVIAEATGPGGATVTFTASAADIVDPSPLLVLSPASGSLFPIGVTTVTATATDAAGNTRNGSFTVTVRDTTAPVLNLPPNIVAEAAGPGGTVVSFTAGATDIVDSAPVLVLSRASGSLFPLGITTVAVTATDASANSSHGSFTVTVHDTTAPILPPPPNIIVMAEGSAGTEVAFAPVATDAVGCVVTTTPPSRSRFPLGVTTVQVTAGDAAGHTAEGSFTVTVVGMRDWTLDAATAVAPARLSGTIRGMPGGSVILQASADLGISDPWEDVATIPLDATGTAVFARIEDLNSIGLARDFFRLRLP